MAKDKEEDGKDEGLVIVTDDAKNLDVDAPSEREDREDDLPPKKAKGAFEGEDDDDEDKKAAAKEQEDKDEDEDTEDKRLGASEETEAEEEAKKQERATHKSRRQKRKEAEQKLRNENRFYQLRNEKLEKQVQDLAKRQDSTEKQTLEKEIANNKALIRKAESVMAEAVTNSKGDELAEATRIRDQLRDRVKDLEEVHKEASKEPEQEERQPPNPQVVVRAQNFAKNNDWFDFGRGDYDSKIAGAIDDSLWQEGFDPATDEYWNELNKRIAKALPHRAKKKAKNGHDREDEDVDDDDEDEDEDRRPPKKKRKDHTVRAGNGGPKFRTGGPGRDLKGNEVYLSRERIEALKEAGVWDDPVQREKHLKRYREWDRENAHLYK